MKGDCTQKVDIYSFGIIMHEVLTSLFPFSDAKLKYQFAFQLCDEIVLSGLRPFVENPTDAPLGYKSLMVKKKN